MVTLNRYLADVHARGIRVAEHPDYGGVSNWLHMPGSEHAKGNAGDLNFGPAGAPASERPALRWAARLADAAGLNVIYAYHRTHPIRSTNDNHKDHAHVDGGPITAYRAPGADDALYQRILDERPPVGSRKPRRMPVLRRDGGRPWYNRIWQQRLREADLYKGKIDGDFGPGTEEATKRFQKRTGLDTDGVVGQATWYMGARGSKPGGKSWAVKILQLLCGFTGKAADSEYGTATRRRAEAVQLWAGVKPDGDIGPKTVDALIKKG